MAVYTVTNQYVSINSVDLSARLQGFDCARDKASNDVTAMNSTGDKAYVPGLKDKKITVNLYQDFDAGSTNATLKACYDSGSLIAVVWKPVNATTSATNPQFTAQCILTSYGESYKVGDVTVITANFQVSGAIAEATS